MATSGRDAVELGFAVGPERQVSGLLTLPAGARALYVLAHGAGAGMRHPFLATMATALAERGIATLRYQFPYMEAGGRRPDSPAVAHAAVRAAVAEGARRAPGVPLIAGGKSFGGRMTSQAEALEPLPGVVGLAFLGFPLHPPGKPGDERGDHLKDVRLPMLFLQGTRDEFAELGLLEPLCRRLEPARHPAPRRWRQPFLQGAGQERAQGRRRQGRTGRCACHLDRGNPEEIEPVSALLPNWTPQRHFTITAHAPRA